MCSTGFEAHTYQTVAMSIKCTHIQFTTSLRIAYDRVLCVEAIEHHYYI